MKKILIEGMSENLGGIETFVHLLFSVLKDTWQVDFITVNDRIPFEEEFLAAGSRIHRITPRYRSVKQFCADIDRVFEENRYDVFWFNKTTLSSIRSITSAKKHGVPKVIVHSHQSRNMGNFLTLLMHKANAARIRRYADVRAACSAVAANWFFGKNIGDVQIFPNSVDESLYAPKVEKAIAMKEELGLEGKFLVGNVARFCPEKNHAFLIEIFADLAKKVPNAHLVLCGTGDLMEPTRALVKEKGLENRVSFLGSRKDMPRVYQAIDVFVMPSLFEGLPFTLVEAQAAGIPCVVSDTVSRESALTDIIEFIPLDAGLSRWSDRIAARESYRKVSKRDQLEQKGFTMEAFARKVHAVLEESPERSHDPLAENQEKL